MRKGRIAAGMLVLAAAAGSLLVSTVPVASQTEPERVVLRVFETNRGAHYTDVNEAPRTDWGAEGDWTVGTQKLLHPQECDAIGRNISRFTVARQLAEGQAWVIADITTNLSGDRITIYGAFRTQEFSSEAGVDHAVTGGTGQYKDATGEVIVKPARRCNQEGALYRFDLLV